MFKRISQMKLADIMYIYTNKYEIRNKKYTHNNFWLIYACINKKYKGIEPQNFTHYVRMSIEST